MYKPNRSVVRFIFYNLIILFISFISFNNNLSADKVKRLSLIRDKQEAIKFFLSEIAEEGESTNNCLTPSSERYATKSIVINLNSIEEKPDQDISSPTKSNNTITNNNDIETKSTTMATTNEETTMIDDINKNNLLDNLEQHINGSNDEHVNDINGHNHNNLDDLDLIKTNQNNTNHDSNNSLKENQKFELNFNSNENLNEDNNHLVYVDTKLNIDSNNLVNNSTHNQLLDIDKLDISNKKKDVKLDDDIEIFSKPKQSAASSSVKNGGIINVSDASNEQITKLMNELNEMKERERGYLDKIDTLEEENKKFKMVAVEFESVFHQLIKDKDDIETKLKNEIIELTKERDHLQEDVVGVERAFDDLHRRFEKLKVKVEEFKKVCFLFLFLMIDFTLYYDK